jgi:predicted GNAT family acetyltransferase
VPAELPAELRRVTAADGPALRDLRLEALADTPIGYVEALAAARELPDDAWAARARRGSPDGDSFQVLAEDGGRPVATAVGFRSSPDRATLAAVYVTPAHRGRGLLDRMVDAVAGWAVEQGATGLRLLVHEDNAPARRAYARLGFTATGHTEPYPLDAGAVEHELVRPL